MWRIGDPDDGQYWVLYRWSDGHVSQGYAIWEDGEWFLDVLDSGDLISRQRAIQDGLDTAAVIAWHAMPETPEVICLTLGPKREGRYMFEPFRLDKVVTPEFFAGIPVVRGTDEYSWAFRFERRTEIGRIAWETEEGTHYAAEGLIDAMQDKLEEEGVILCYELL